MRSPRMGNAAAGNVSTELHARPARGSWHRGSFWGTPGLAALGDSSIDLHLWRYTVPSPLIGYCLLPTAGRSSQDERHGKPGAIGIRHAWCFRELEGFGWLVYLVGCFSRW